MNLRPATINDAALLLLWRNDEITRQNSRNSNVITLEDHTHWLQDSLQNSARILRIAEVEGIPVGTVRADIREDGYTEISYTIAPEARGKGYATLMARQFVAQECQGKKLKAEIKKGGNEASEAVARALGLSPKEERASHEADPRPLVVWK